MEIIPWVGEAAYQLPVEIPFLVTELENSFGWQLIFSNVQTLSGNEK